MTDFKIGDTVKLKSGSPLMTITDTTGGWISCIFFSKEKQDFIKLKEAFHCFIISSE